MKRILLSTLFLAAFGLALAGPPVDYQLYCGVEGVLQPVGVASEVDGERQVMLVDGALDWCDSTDDGDVVVYGFLLGEEPVDEGEAFSIVFAFDADEETWGLLVDVDDPVTTIDEVPQVAVDGKLGAMQHRAEAFRMAEEARARAEEHAAGPPMELPEPATRGRP
jgi:hypothetical protein